MSKYITSRNTSVNKDKLPAIYTKLTKHGAYGTHIFDVGCGKWTKHISEFAKENAICTYWHGFDPFNQTREHNNKITDIAREEKLKPNKERNPNIFISSNVLNVICGPDRQRAYLVSIFRMMKDCDECYISVYEGNKTGIGKETKKDCWQENKKLSDYFELVQMAYRDTHMYDYTDRIPVHYIDIKYGMIRVLPAYW